MDQQQQASSSLTGAERIRALKDDNAVFTAFDTYPWNKDKNFMSGLYAILGEPGQQNPQASLADMAIHARIFYYAQRIGVNIDFGAYKTWLDTDTDHQAPDVLPEEYHQRDEAKATSAPALDWQKAAPKSDLYIDRKAAAAAQSGSQDQPNYPMGFAEMIKLIQEGKPVPGIRQIPNTVVRNPAVKPVGAMAAPRKPWEKHVTADAQTLPDLPRALDTEFPPLHDDVAVFTSSGAT
ncbi:Ff.00g057550.m01.CDS01 [Fusarium sp. VM40]|nr:Ff.00g057550.m01.CDS01 [Fusarium sp. VM40]